MLTSQAENIEQKRQESINRIMTCLHDLLAKLCEGNGCSFECSSILLGALTKEMHARHLLSPRPAIPFPGLSFAEIAESVRAFRSPRWWSQYGTRSRHNCSLDADLNSIVDSVENSMGGLTLEDLSPP
jgi:hypothetical protein